MQDKQQKQHAPRSRGQAAHSATQSQPKLWYHSKDQTLLMPNAEKVRTGKGAWERFCAGCGSKYTDMRDLKDHVKNHDRCPLKDG